MMAEASNNHGKSDFREDPKASPRGENSFIQTATFDPISHCPESSELANLYSKLQIGEQNSSVQEPERTVDFANESFCVDKYDYPLETTDPLVYYKRTLETNEKRNSADSTDSMNSEATTIRCDFNSETSPNGVADTAQPASESHTSEATRNIPPLRTALALRKASRISKPEVYSSKRKKWWRLFAKLRSQDKLKLE